MRRQTMLRFGVAIAAVLVLVVIVYGAVQAEEEFNDDTSIAVATSTPAVVAVPEPDPQAAEEAASPYIPPPLPADLPPKPPVGYALTGSDILYQVRGGDDPCRFLYTSNRVGTFAGTETGLWFVAGVWEADLEQYDEMHLYGPNGPHRFYFKDSAGQATSFIEVPHGATVYYSITFPVPGLYYLYDRLAPELGAVGEITAAPAGQTAGVSQTGWCPS